MIGILALQGNYQMHSQMLDKLNEKNILIKNSSDLDGCDGLIIPGGESTVMSKMMHKYDLFDSIKKFGKEKGVFGTCAGLILMSNYDSENIIGLDLLNISVSRNAWGSQINSFTNKINIDIDNKIKNFEATFIRAPRIKRTDKIDRSMRILAYFKDEPIMIQHGLHIATTFHPEMHNDTLIHEYFLNIINENK